MWAGPLSLRPPIVSSTTCAFSRPRSNSARSLRATWTSAAGGSIFSSFASLGLMRIALSQEIFVIGSGHSWSQPLLLKRPSSIVRPATNRTSIASADTAGRAPAFSSALPTAATLNRAGIARYWLPAIRPSWRNFRKMASPLGPAAPAIVL